MKTDLTVTRIQHGSERESKLEVVSIDADGNVLFRDEFGEEYWAMVVWTRSCLKCGHDPTVCKKD